ncbi:MAG: MBL fold metallo-hydrolase [Nitrospirae bacterium]|nr:MBL fold metallo-hydrolase [Nitrospirota bacterium]
MRILVLGSGTSTGVPMIGCRCEVCLSADPKNRRTRSSILVQASGKNLLVDTSTDLRQQALAYAIDRVDAVLYTHAHADHVHGIDELRSFNHIQGGEIPCYGSPEVLERVRRNFNYIFNGTSEGWKPRLALHAVEKEFEVFGIPVIPIPIFHGGDRIIYGYRFGSAAYLTDCSGIPEESVSLLLGLDVLILDATRYQPHPNHLSFDQALEAAGNLRPRRTILTHLSHVYDHERVNRDLPEGIELAYDGMEIGDNDGL